MTGRGPQERVVAHYGGSGLYERIVAAIGKPEAEIGPDDLKSVDEFHIGGAEATERLLDPLGLPPGTHVLDLGSGIGGPARRMASRYQWEVTGVDLTPAFVETAKRLTALAGHEIGFIEGSILGLPFPDATFDLATLIHVGMNVADKDDIFAEVSRVLRPGGTFAVYEVMQIGARHPEFPLPWADGPEVSFLADPETYRRAGRTAGFELVAEVERAKVAKAFFDRLAAIVAGGEVRAGLPLIMGSNASDKVRNMVAAINAGNIAPVEMIFRKPA